MRLLYQKEIWALGLTFITTFLTGFFTMVLFIGPSFINRPSLHSEPIAEAKLAVTQTPAEEEKSLNVVLLGHGGEGHDGGGLSDAIILLNIYPDSKVVKVISIPRDLWVNLPFQENKINHAFAEGITPLKDAVATVTGLRPEYFMAINFTSFQEAIDELGGVTVNVPVAFDDHFYPIKGLENETCGFSPEKINEVHEKHTGFELEKQFECRYEKLHFETGPQKMDGATALKYARSRHSGEHGGDFARSERQQSLLLGLKDTLLNLKALNNIPVFFDRMKGFVTTDIDVSTAVAMAKLVADPTEYKVKHITLTTDDVLSDGKSAAGAYILFPKEGLHKWDKIKEYISSH